MKSLRTGFTSATHGGDERDLARRAQRGDREAYEDLVRLHYARALATARHLLGNREDAEDLVQEAFVRAHRGLASFRAEGSFAGWLRRIVVHLARDRFRAGGREPRRTPLSAAAAVPASGDPGATLRRQELTRVVDAALRSLPDPLRVALVLRSLDGLGYDEIAEALGVTPATARTQVMKARRTLTARLEPYLRGGEA